MTCKVLTLDGQTTIKDVPLSRASLKALSATQPKDHFLPGTGYVFLVEEYDAWVEWFNKIDK